MKTFFAILGLFVAVSWSDAHAQEIVGQCVYPRVFSPEGVRVWETAAMRTSAFGKLKYQAYRATHRNGRMVAIFTSADSSIGDGYFVGWVEITDLDIVSQRNCN